MAGPRGLAVPETAARRCAPAGGAASARATWLAVPAAAWLALQLTACGGHLPPAPPLPPSPAQFREAPAPDTAAETAAPVPAEGAWWQAFGDPRLDALQQQALADHPTLALAQARVARARALADLAAAEGRPLLALTAGASRQAGLLVNDAGTDGTLWRAGLSLQHGIDLGGGQDRSTQAAQRDLLQQQALLRHTRLQLQADLAASHLALQGLQQQLALQQGLVDAWQRTATLHARRLQTGLASAADTTSAQSEVASAAARQQALGRELAAQRHALQALLGDSTAAPAHPGLPPSALPFRLPAIPPGLPSQLLARRADVAAAAQAVQAARLRLGATQASAWPSLRLTAGGGMAAAELGDLLRSAARQWSLAGLLSLPLLDGGRRDARQAAAEADLALAAAQWRGQMLQALREVDDQLSALQTLQAQAADLERGEAASDRALQLQQGLLARGLASPLAVLEAQRRLLADRQALAQVQVARQLATVGLVRALGGGWGDATEAPALAAAAAAH